LSLLVCLISTSCSMPVTVNLFNHSGIDQIVLIKDRSIHIKAGESESIQSIEYSEFRIESEKTKFRYTVENLPLSNVVWRGWGPFSKRMFYAQLESDGKIWATESVNLATKFSEQPEGFPVEPNT
jgi:hypothetical protein